MSVGVRNNAQETGSGFAWGRVAGTRQILGTCPTRSWDTRQQYQLLDLQSSVQSEDAGSLVQKVLNISRQEEQRTKSDREPSEHRSPKHRVPGDCTDGRSGLAPLGDNTECRSVSQPCHVEDSGY